MATFARTPGQGQWLLQYGDLCVDGAQKDIKVRPGGAAFGVLIHPYFPMVEGNNIPAQGQAQSPVLLRIFGCEERIEDPVAYIPWDAYAVIAEHYLRIPARGRERNAQAERNIGVMLRFQAVPKYALDDFLQLVAVSLH